MLISKVDLVMWTKNGSRTLPLVLKQIDEVIPEEFVNNRILVDDQSIDTTRDIAKSFGWKVFFNEAKGIGSGANTALKHVTSDLFISFEQDLLLAKGWWNKVPRHLKDDKVAVASGVRVSDHPCGLKKVQEYSTKRMAKMGDPFYGKTFDNTIYKTNIIRKLGGFPNLSVSAGLDSVLAYKVFSAGYEWRVDYTTLSLHLRHGLRDALAHYYWYGTVYEKLRPLLHEKKFGLRRNVLRVFVSPLIGLDMTIKEAAPEAFYIYPFIRLNVLKGILDGRRKYTR